MWLMPASCSWIVAEAVVDFGGDAFALRLLRGDEPQGVFDARLLLTLDGLLVVQFGAMLQQANRRRVRGHLNQAQMFFIRLPRLPVINRKRAEHFFLLVENRRGPAGEQAVRQRQPAIRRPQRILRNVLDIDRLTPERRRAA